MEAGEDAAPRSMPRSRGFAPTSDAHRRPDGVPWRPGHRLDTPTLTADHADESNWSGTRSRPKMAGSRKLCTWTISPSRIART